MAIGVIMLGIVAWMLADVFIWFRPDICDPPYFQAELQRLGLVVAGTLIIMGYFIVSGMRPVSWGETVQWRLLTWQYGVAALPALVVMAIQLM